MRLGELLNIIDPRADRIAIGLRSTDLEHVQDDLRILGIILVPAVVESFTCPRKRDRGHEPQRNPSLKQAIGERPMIVAGCFEASHHRPTEGQQSINETVML